MNWFQRRGFFFVPVARPAWIIFTVIVAYLVFAFLKIDSRSHSISDTLMSWSMHVLVAGLVYTGIAYFTTAKK